MPQPTQMCWLLVKIACDFYRGLGIYPQQAAENVTTCGGHSALLAGLALALKSPKSRCRENCKTSP